MRGERSVRARGEQPLKLRRAARRGFTLVELILALGICAMVVAAVSAMLVSVSYGTSARRDLRDLVVRGETVDARVALAIRSARAVLETGTDYLIVWMSDSKKNDAPNLSEIRLIERALDNTLKSYQFPGNWTQAEIDAADAQYTLSGNLAGFFRTATTNAKNAGSFVSTHWGSGVTAATFALDGADPAAIPLAAYRLTLQTGDLTETVIGAASLRSKSLGG